MRRGRWIVAAAAAVIALAVALSWRVPYVADGPRSGAGGEPAGPSNSGAPPEPGPAGPAEPGPDRPAEPGPNPSADSGPGGPDEPDGGGAAA